jgi:hypothetical protein
VQGTNADPGVWERHGDATVSAVLVAMQKNRGVPDPGGVMFVLFNSFKFSKLDTYQTAKGDF